jgi:antitoxin component YwqK of YwqJK toxin-antitoxin module
MAKIIFLGLFFLASCGIPDLQDSQIMEEAKAQAVSLDSLERKLMYGMIQLYVDRKEEPFSGWVKQSDSKDSITSLGYLKKGQKEGIWLEWYPNGSIRAKTGWHQDRYEGEFKGWYPNGRIKVIGQTSDGEVDGQWKSFYTSGLPASESISETGLAVSAKVWTPSGEPCPHTNLKNGNGILYQYQEDGSVLKIQKFANGVGLVLKP